MPRSIRWAVAGRPALGEAISGDRCTVIERSHEVLIVVVDGLGHGKDAAEAAMLAVSTVQEQSGSTLNELIQACHQQLRSTRGVALSAALLDIEADRIYWVGVGNVEGVLIRGPSAPRSRPERLLNLSGVVGYQLPARIQPLELPLWVGDRVVFATDGVASAFVEALSVRLPLQQAAGWILQRFARSDDDALVLVADYVGDSS